MLKKELEKRTKELEEKIKQKDVDIFHLNNEIDELKTQLNHQTYFANQYSDINRRYNDAMEKEKEIRSLIKKTIEDEFLAETMDKLMGLNTSTDEWCWNRILIEVGKLKGVEEIVKLQRSE